MPAEVPLLVLARPVHRPASSVRPVASVGRKRRRRGRCWRRCTLPDHCSGYDVPVPSPGGAIQLPGGARRRCRISRGQQVGPASLPRGEGSAKYRGPRTGRGGLGRSRRKEGRPIMRDDGRVLASRVLDSPRTHGVWPPTIEQQVCARCSICWPRPACGSAGRAPTAPQAAPCCAFVGVRGRHLPDASLCRSQRRPPNRCQDRSPMRRQASPMKDSTEVGPPPRRMPRESPSRTAPRLERELT